MKRAERGQIVGEFAVIILLLFVAIVLCALLIPPQVQAVLTDAPGEAIQNLSAALDMSNGHSTEKHGDEVNAAINSCFNQSGSMMTWQNGNGRRVEVCKTPDGKWALRFSDPVNGGWRLVTQFLKDKMNSIDQVIQYLKNTGYTPIQ